VPAQENIQAGVFFGFFCHSNDNQLKFNVKKNFPVCLTEYGTENAFFCASAARRCGGSGATELQS
jgi:hypothetical protein